MSYRLSLVFLVGCSAAVPTALDAASQLARDPAGTFVVHSELDVPIPALANAALAPLADATDGPDDPMRWVLDRAIDTLPDGTVKTVARDAAPLVAAYLNERLTDLAPRLVTGLAAIASGAARIARHVATTETLQIEVGGSAIRTITGARFELGATPVELVFVDQGLADVEIATAVTLVGGRLTIADHVEPLPYGALLRLGLDRAVIPSVDPAASDLASALADLVDCAMLGELVSQRVGYGSPELYRAACAGGLTAVASQLYAQLAEVGSVQLEVLGAGDAIDLDGNGTMDTIRAGAWSGTISSGGARDVIGAATFEGAKY